MKRFWFWFAVTLAVKLAVATWFPLLNDEAYYWVWSKHLQLSYFDHPAMVAWLLKLGEPFEFLGNAIRFPAIILSHFGYLAWYYIFEELEISEAFWPYFILSFFSPMLGIGSIVITPDQPVILFWSFSTLFAIRCLKKQSALDYFLFGIFLGVGFCSKYHIVLLPLSLALGLIYAKALNRVSWRLLPLTILGGLLACSPVLIWNYKNDFASFAFQLRHGLGDAWKPSRPFAYLGGEILAIFPTVVYLFVIGFKKIRANQLAKVLTVTALFPFVFFFFTSFKSFVEINWPIVAFPAFYAIAAIGLRNFRIVKITSAIWVLLVLFVLVKRPGKANEPYRFDGLVPYMHKYEPTYADTYQMASTLWYKTKTPFYKLRGFSRFDFFDTLEQSAPPQSGPFYLINFRQDDFPEWLTNGSYNIETVEQINADWRITRIQKK